MENTLDIEQAASDLYTRPSKRRKYYRKRGEEELPTVEDDTKMEAGALTIDELISFHGSLHSSHESQGQPLPLSAAEIISHRKVQRRRLGIEFNTSNTVRTILAPESSSVTKKDDTPEIKTLIDRFTPQTGQVADVDKHM